MTRIHTLLLLGACLGSTALVGCGADVPQHPTWHDDVQPIVVARCARCHNSTEAGDPEYMNGRSALGNFDYASFDDFGTVDRGLFLVSVPLLQSSDPAMRMPPPPAAKLADWQIETIQNFVKDNSPSQ